MPSRAARRQCGPREAVPRERLSRADSSPAQAAPETGRPGSSRRATCGGGGTVGRAANSQIIFQETLYHEIVKKAEGRLENARAFLERVGRG